MGATRKKFIESESRKKIPRKFETRTQEAIEVCEVLVAHGGIHYVPVCAVPAPEFC